jgi:dTDP-4-amino-4,6-dideoxy-D-galactose acyltransferase
LLIENTNNAWAYFPLSFIADREVSNATVCRDLNEDVFSGQTKEFVSSEGVTVFYKKLQWDSDFFGTPTFRIEYTSIPDNSSENAVNKSFNEFRVHLGSSNSGFYVFAEVPSEDTAVLVGMTGSGWRLIETRITCFRDDMQNFNFIDGFPTRSAVIEDIPDLRSTAIKSVNPFDRFHSDKFFSAKQADEFMATFIENSVNGYADEVIVPAVGLADAFLTGVYLPSSEIFQRIKIAKPVLSAVSAERKGWYKHLIGSLGNTFRLNGVDIAFMSTQATNRAVQKVWFQHGFRFGRTTHVISTFAKSEKDLT